MLLITDTFLKTIKDSTSITEIIQTDASISVLGWFSEFISLGSTIKNYKNMKGKSDTKQFINNEKL